MGGRKGIEQEKNKRSGEILDKVEGMYSRRRYLEGERKLKKRKKVD